MTLGLLVGFAAGVALRPWLEAKFNELKGNESK